MSKRSLNIIRLSAVLPLAAALLASAPSHAAPEAAPASVAPATCAKPRWPTDSITQREQGTVVLNFRIDEDGSVGDTKVVKSSGYPRLDKAAQKGLSLCKFKPSVVNGQPQQSWMMMQYVWEL